jgi:hypothetical protein
MRNANAALFVAGVFLCAGCATTLPSDLVPAIGNREGYVPSGKSLSVAAVTGERAHSDFGQVIVDGDVVREAMIETLRGSAMFRTVSAAPEADYILSPRVIGEKHRPFISLVLVRYELRETVSGRTIWSGNLFSEKVLTVGDVFLGEERSRKLRQAVFHDNFTQLTSQVSKALSSH